MRNSQCALLAAATVAVRLKDDPTTERVTAMAERYLAWLDDHEVKKSIEETKAERVEDLASLTALAAHVSRELARGGPGDSEGQRPG